MRVVIDTHVLLLALLDPQRLSRRERELLDTVARGMDNLQIAAHLGLAEKTVRNLLSRLYGKLAIEGRPQAIVWAREHGYGQR